MTNMQFALLLLSVAAFSTAAPQNFTAHFQTFKASPTDPTPSSINTTINKDGAIRTTDRATRATTGASNATDNVTEASIGFTVRSDGISQTVESSTNSVSGTTTELADDENSTNAFIRTGGGVRTTTGSVVHGDRSKDQGNATKIESGEVEEPGTGFNFKLPSYFLTFLQKVPASSEISPNVRGIDDSYAISNSQHSNGGLTIDINQPPTTLNRTTTASTTTTTSPFIALSTSSSRHNVLSTSDFNNQTTFIPSGSLDAPSSSGHSLLSSSDFNNQTTFIPSGSLDAPNSSGHNLLSTSDFYNQHTPLRPEHSTRVKKSLTESKLSRNHEVIAPSSLHLHPDYYVPPFTAVGEDNSNAYNNDYYSQSFPQVRTPVVYEAAASHSGNNGGYSGQFQYIIRTANLPGLLATFPASDSSSAVHSNSPDTYSSQGVPSTGSQSGVGHVSLTSQPASHVSLLPNFQSSSKINFASNPQPSFGFANSLSGASPPKHQQTKADSASGTSRPDGTSNSTTTETSIAFHAGHQQTKASSASGTQNSAEKYNYSTTTTDTSNAFHAGHQQTKAGSASATHSSDETYYSTTTEGSISSQGTNQIFSTRISDSSNNVTSSSNKTTEFPLFDYSEVTTTSTVGVKKNTDQNVGKGKPARNF